MIDRNYRCDLCRDTHNLNSMTGLNQLIGIYWVGKIIEERPPRDVEHHLCVKCLSSIQAMPKRCGQGFECAGGPKCSSAHLATPAANGPGEAVAWMPIESAPLDKNILLWWVPVSENKYAEACVIGQISSHKPGMWWNGQRGEHQALSHVTHWRPLPAPPGASESTQQPGMVTVPREPTKDMLEEGFDAINKQYARDPLDDALERTQAVYRAMLDAAQRSTTDTKHR